MECDEFSRMLDRYAELSEEEAAMLDAHAAECESCAGELAFMRSVIYTVKNLPPIEPPEDFLASLNARIDKETARESAANRFIRRTAPYVRKYGALAACLAVGIAIGMNSDMLVSRMNSDGEGVISTETVVLSTAKPETVISDQKMSTSAPAFTAPSVSTAAPNSFPVQTAVPAVTPKKPSVSSKTQPVQTQRPAVSSSTARQNIPAVSGTDRTDMYSGLKPDISAVSAQPEKPSTSTVPESSIGKNAGNTATSPIPANTEETQPKKETDTPEAQGRAYSIDRSAGQSDEIAAHDQMRIAPNPNPDQITDMPSVYRIARREDSEDVYAAADTEPEAQSADDYSIASEPPVEEAYVAPLSSTLLVKSDDTARVRELVAVFISATYGNYYMITSKDMHDLLNQLDREGIWYDANIFDSGDKISFKLVIA